MPTSFTITLSYLFATVAMILAACDSDLSVETKGSLGVDCRENPSAESCQDELTSLNFQILTNSFVTNNPSVEIKWQAPENALSYTVGISKTQDCSDIIFNYDQFENHKKLDILNDGHYFVCVTAILEDGSKEVAKNNGLRITVDRVKPVLKRSDVSFLESEKETRIDVESTDLTDITYQWTQVSGDGEVIFSDPNDVKSLFTATKEGTYELKLTAVDEAGNSEEMSFPFVWDVTPPLIDAGDDISIKTLTAALKATTTEATQNHKWTMVSGPAVAAAKFSTAQSPSTDAILSVYGTYVFKVTAEDFAGNIGEDTVSVTLYGGSISFTSIDLVEHAVDGFVNSIDSADVHKALVGNLVASGQVTTSYGLSTIEKSCSTVTYGSAIPKTSDLSALVDGSYKVCVKLEAPEADTVYGESTSFIKDTTAPIPPAASAFSQGVYHNAKTVTALWALSSSGDVSVQEIQYFRDASCGVPSGSAVAKTKTQNTDSFVGLSGNTYSYTVSVTDLAGNVSQSTCATAITIDVTAPSAPTGLNWSGSNPTNTVPVTASWTFQRQVILQANPFSTMLTAAVAVPLVAPSLKAAPISLIISLQVMAFFPLRS